MQANFYVKFDLDNEDFKRISDAIQLLEDIKNEMADVTCSLDGEIEAINRVCHTLDEIRRGEVF